MAKRGCLRVYFLVLFLFSSLVLSFPNSEVNFSENASASSAWVQTDSADFLRGKLSNVEVIGYDGESFLRLNRSREWSEVTPNPSPSPRKGHSMVFDASVNATVLFGGRNETTYFGDTWLYFSGNNTWAEVHPSNSPTPREGHAVAYDSENELILLFGGYDGSGYLSDTWVYSTRGNVWTNLTPSPHPSERAWSAMSYDRTAKYVLLYGGRSSSQFLADTWKFDLSENQWSRVYPPTIPRERHGHSMVYDESLNLHILMGGFGREILKSDAWSFNSTTESWENLFATGVPMPRSNHGMVYDSLKKELLVFGGYGNATYDNEDRLSVLPCPIPEGDLATTMLEFEGYIYIGSSNATNHAYIYRYDPVTDVCVRWRDTRVYYIYSSGKYGGVAFWGSREAATLTSGPLFYYDGSSFGSIPGNVWFSSVPISGWVQDFEVFNNRIYLSGTLMEPVPENSNNFFVKYCDNPPCLSVSDWHWTDTSPLNIGVIDDGVVLEEFMGDLYLGSYDWASVLKYYPSNGSWWYSLNASVDGDTPGQKGGFGVFGLVNYSGSLHALTYGHGWHWKTQDGASWTGINESFESFTRGFVFKNRLYSGARDAAGNHLASIDGSSWSKTALSSDSFLYFADCGNSLCMTSGSKVLRREAYHNDLWKYHYDQSYWEELIDIGPPEEREGFGLAYDRYNHVTVLFGGADESGYYGDTYIFDKTVGSGIFTSATFDSGDTTLQTHWDSISWSLRTEPMGSSIRFQIASNNDNATWMFRGPDGTAGSFYVDSQGEGIWSGHDGDRFLRFRAFLSTTSPIGPILNSVKISYDHAPAQPVLGEPANGIWTNDDSPRFTWTFNDFDPDDSQTGFQVLVADDLSFTNIAFDSGDQTSPNEYWQLPSTLSSGTWYWKVRTKDSDGIWGEFSSPHLVKIDTESPLSVISTPASNSNVNVVDSINGSSDDSLSGVASTELSLKEDVSGTYWNGTGWQDQEFWLLCKGRNVWGFDASSVDWVSERTYTVRSRALDTAGNLEVPSEGTSFVYDSTRPTVTLINPSGAESFTGGRNLDIRWDVYDPYLNQTSIQISYSTDGGENWKIISENEFNDGSFNWTLPGMKMELRIRLQAEDLAGNTGFDMSDIFYVVAPEREDWLTEYWWIILIIVLVAAALAAYYWKKISRKEEIKGPPPIVATAGETTLCAVCLGTIKEGLSVIRCGECGKTFHEKCAARIEECPNCESKLDLSEIVEE